MTTTFPPSEVSVRHSLVLFQFLTSTMGLIIMILLVIALSMGYAICTGRTVRDELIKSTNNSCQMRRRLVNNTAESPYPSEIMTPVGDSMGGRARFNNNMQQIILNH